MVQDDEGRPTRTGQLRVVIADPQPVTRIGIRMVLEANEAQIIGEAHDEPGLVSLIDEQTADIAIVDPHVASSTGPVHLVRALCARVDYPSVVVYSSIESRDELLPLFLVGAHNYVSKDEAPSRLVEAVHDAARGRQSWFIGRLGDVDGRWNDGLSRLSSRERDVFSLMAMRLSNAEIAAELSISLQTVKNHASHILRKLGAKNRAELFDRAGKAAG